jgi:heptosyltransferase III
LSQRILVMRGGALGDFILGLPALRALRRAFPAAHLELVAPAAVLPLAYPLVDLAIPIERSEMSAFFGEAELPGDLASRYAGLDLAVVWLADQEGLVRRHFERLGTERVLQAPALPPDSRRVHATDYLLGTLRPFMPTSGSGAPPFAVPIVHPSPDARKRTDDLLRNLGVLAESVVAIHPGSGGTWKCWPAARFAQVADVLTAHGRRVVLIQGPADEEVVEKVRASMKDEPSAVISGLPIMDLAALLSSCACYLGNDSGVTHLAAAVGVPVVAIFGPTDPAIWGPRGRSVEILRDGSGQLESISVEQVAKAVKSLELTRG